MKTTQRLNILIGGGIISVLLILMDIKMYRTSGKSRLLDLSSSLSRLINIKVNRNEEIHEIHKVVNRIEGKVDHLENAIIEHEYKYKHTPNETFNDFTGKTQMRTLFKKAENNALGKSENTTDGPTIKKPKVTITVTSPSPLRKGLDNNTSNSLPMPSTKLNDQNDEVKKMYHEVINKVRPETENPMVSITKINDIDDYKEYGKRIRSHDLENAKFKSDVTTRIYPMKALNGLDKKLNEDGSVRKDAGVNLNEPLIKADPLVITSRGTGDLNKENKSHAVDEKDLVIPMKTDFKKTNGESSPMKAELKKPVDESPLTKEDNTPKIILIDKPHLTPLPLFGMKPLSDTVLFEDKKKPSVNKEKKDSLFGIDKKPMTTDLQKKKTDLDFSKKKDELKSIVEKLDSDIKKDEPLVKKSPVDLKKNNSGHVFFEKSIESKVEDSTLPSPMKFTITPKITSEMRKTEELKLKKKKLDDEIKNLRQTLKKQDDETKALQDDISIDMENEEILGLTEKLIRKMQKATKRMRRERIKEERKQKRGGNFRKFKPARRVLFSPFKSDPFMFNGIGKENEDSLSKPFKDTFSSNDSDMSLSTPKGDGELDSKLGNPFPVKKTQTEVIKKAFPASPVEEILKTLAEGPNRENHSTASLNNSDNE